MGGIKDMLSPPCQNMGGIHHPHPPRDLRPCIMVTYPIVIGGGGGTNLCSNSGGGIFLDNGRYCNTSRLRYRSYDAYTALFNFIARGFEGMLFREFFF